ncbi:hypothetical protein GCM10022239_14630 [Leifsonia bigeumensis]|uniref:DUF4245 domain-containing protein n=1 Tax=Leifsonella bigeumensis TaxID=433643 RepID=A0ABP7FHJ0_9MICO
MSPDTPPRSRQPPVVAELGRPETPQEIADRKAESSRRHRQGQTFLNLALALVACLLVVLVTVLVVVRPDPPAREPIDYQAIAAEADAGVPLAAPSLPEGWTSNAASFSAMPADGVANWYVGFLTPKEQFVALRQGIDANPTWVSNQLAGRSATGSTVIDGVTWQVYDHRLAKDAGNLAYAMTATGTEDESGRTSSYVLFGTAPDDEFEVLASALAPTIRMQR